MGFDLKKAVGQIAKNAPNMQEAQKGGGDYEPPAEGPCFLRFIGYIELGKQKSTFKGETKTKDKVRLIFEVHGKNYPPKKLDDGTLIPTRITVTETLSLSEKAHFFKIFNSMRNNRSEITHMAQMLGEGFLGRITHNTGKEDKVFANLRNDAGYSIRPPYREDPETGESTKLKVPDAISELRLFVWDQPSKEMWDSLFIDGEYEEGKSKNVIQNAVLAAANFKGSPLEQLLAGAMPDDGDPDDDPEVSDDPQEYDPEVNDPPPDTPAPKATKAAKPKAAKAPAKKADKPASADPLDGIGDDDIPY